MAQSTFICKTCGQSHEGIPDLSFRRPDALLALPQGEREMCFENDEGCSIPSLRGAQGRFFLRCVLLIPLTDGPQDHFGFGPWAEVARTDYDGVMKQQAGDIIRPFSGTLATELPGFPESRGLPVIVTAADCTQRPKLTLAAPKHSLTEAQRTGITAHAALGLIRLF